MGASFGIQPVAADHQYLATMPVDQVQHIAEVAPIDRRDYPAPIVRIAQDQQRGVGRDLVAGHQPEASVDIVLDPHRLVEAAEQRGAIDRIVAGQVDRAYERHGRHLLAQSQFRLVAGAPRHRHDLARGERGVVEHSLELPHRIPGCLLRRLLEASLGLPVEDEQPQDDRHHPDQHGQRQPERLSPGSLHRNRHRKDS